MPNLELSNNLALTRGACAAVFAGQRVSVRS
jgi:hypothetical protein